MISPKRNRPLLFALKHRAMRHGLARGVTAVLFLAVLWWTVFGLVFWIAIR